MDFSRDYFSVKNIVLTRADIVQLFQKRAVVNVERLDNERIKQIKDMLVFEGVCKRTIQWEHKQKKNATKRHRSKVKKTKNKKKEKKGKEMTESLAHVREVHADADGNQLPMSVVTVPTQLVPPIHIAIPRPLPSVAADAKRAVTPCYLIVPPRGILPPQVSEPSLDSVSTASATPHSSVPLESAITPVPLATPITPIALPLATEIKVEPDFVMEKRAPPSVPLVVIPAGVMPSAFLDPVMGIFQSKSHPSVSMPVCNNDTATHLDSTFRNVQANTSSAAPPATVAPRKPIIRVRDPASLGIVGRRFSEDNSIINVNIVSTANSSHGIQSESDTVPPSVSNAVSNDSSRVAMIMDCNEINQTTSDRITQSNKESRAEIGGSNNHTPVAPSQRSPVEVEMMQSLSDNAPPTTPEVYRVAFYMDKVWTHLLLLTHDKESLRNASSLDPLIEDSIRKKCSQINQFLAVKRPIFIRALTTLAARFSPESALTLVAARVRRLRQKQVGGEGDYTFKNFLNIYSLFIIGSLEHSLPVGDQQLSSFRAKSIPDPSTFRMSPSNVPPMAFEFINLNIRPEVRTSTSGDGFHHEIPNRTENHSSSIIGNPGNSSNPFGATISDSGHASTTVTNPGYVETNSYAVRVAHSQLTQVYSAPVVYGNNAISSQGGPRNNSIADNINFVVPTTKNSAGNGGVCHAVRRSATTNGDHGYPDRSNTGNLEKTPVGGNSFHRNLVAHVQYSGNNSISRNDYTANTGTYSAYHENYASATDGFQVPTPSTTIGYRAHPSATSQRDPESTPFTGNGIRSNLMSRIGIPVNTPVTSKGFSATTTNDNHTKDKGSERGYQMLTSGTTGGYRANAVVNINGSLGSPSLALNGNQGNLVLRHRMPVNTSANAVTYNASHRNHVVTRGVPRVREPTASNGYLANAVDKSANHGSTSSSANGKNSCPLLNSLLDGNTLSTTSALFRSDNCRSTFIVTSGENHLATPTATNGYSANTNGYHANSVAKGHQNNSTVARNSNQGTTSAVNRNLPTMASAVNACNVANLFTATNGRQESPHDKVGGSSVAAVAANSQYRKGLPLSYDTLHNIGCGSTNKTNAHLVATSNIVNVDDSLSKGPSPVAVQNPSLPQGNQTIIRGHLPISALNNHAKQVSVSKFHEHVLAPVIAAPVHTRNAANIATATNVLHEIARDKVSGFSTAAVVANSQFPKGLPPSYDTLHSIVCGGTNRTNANPVTIPNIVNVNESYSKSIRPVAAQNSALPQGNLPNATLPNHANHVSANKSCEYVLSPVPAGPVNMRNVTNFAADTNGYHEITRDKVGGSSAAAEATNSQFPNGFPHSYDTLHNIAFGGTNRTNPMAISNIVNANESLSKGPRPITVQNSSHPQGNQIIKRGHLPISALPNKALTNQVSANKSREQVLGPCLAQTTASYPIQGNEAIGVNFPASKALTGIATKLTQPTKETPNSRQPANGDRPRQVLSLSQEMNVDRAAAVPIRNGKKRKNAQVLEHRIEELSSKNEAGAEMHVVMTRQGSSIVESAKRTCYAGSNKISKPVTAPWMRAPKVATSGDNGVKVVGAKVATTLDENGDVGTCAEKEGSATISEVVQPTVVSPRQDRESVIKNNNNVAAPVVEILQAPVVENLDVCIQCGNQAIGLCGACKKVAYCGDECMTSHWVQLHNTVCSSTVPEPTLDTCS